MCCCLPCCLPGKILGACPDRCPLCICFMMVLDIVGVGLSFALVLLVVTNLMEFNEQMENISKPTRPTIFPKDLSNLSNTRIFEGRDEDLRVRRWASNETHTEALHQEAGFNPKEKLKAFQKIMEEFKTTMIAAIAVASFCILPYLHTFFYSISILCGRKFLLKPCQNFRRRIYDEVSM